MKEENKEQKTDMTGVRNRSIRRAETKGMEREWLTRKWMFTEAIL